MAKMSIDDVLNNKYLTDSSLAQQLVAGTLSLDDQIIKDHIHQLGAYIEIYGSGDDSGKEIWYTTSDGEMYDLAGIIEMLTGMGGAYNGPAVVSNEFDEEKQMWCLTFDEDVTVLGDIDLVAFTADGPFFGTNKDMSITCNVETIVLPKTVTRIGDLTFGGCSSLNSITIPNSVTSIGNHAFWSCTGLTSITIPDSVTSIGDRAFGGCTGLKSAIIGDRVTFIGDNVFGGCEGLDPIICKAPNPPVIGNDVFSGSDCLIMVPADSVDAYKEFWSEYADRIEALLNNNQIRYTAPEQLTIKEGVNYVEHTFNDKQGEGIVTFSDDLTTLEQSWFDNTFEAVIERKPSLTLTLPNGVSSIGMGALSGVNEVYYEGTQKECARIDKGWLDGTGIGEYQCFDGTVVEIYNSNMIFPSLLAEASWFVDLIGKEHLPHFLYVVGSVKIDEHPMTAGEFISTLVNGTKDVPGLSTYGFTVITQEFQGVTMPVVHHAESGHSISIVKATDYEFVDPDHIALVDVDESLDPDYMYVLADDTALDPDPTYVKVTIEHKDADPETVTLNANQTYAEQGYEGYYSQDTYNSDAGESADDFLVDNNSPQSGDTIYDYYNNSYNPEVTVTIEHETEDPTYVSLNSEITYADNGYVGYYSQNTYNSETDESADDYLVNDTHPTEGETIYDYCNNIAEPDPEEPEPEEPEPEEPDK